MKIVKKGILPTPPDTKYTGECQNCHCEVELDQRELDEKAKTELGMGRKSLTPFIDCPTEGCKHIIHLSPYVTRNSK